MDSQEINVPRNNISTSKHVDDLINQRKRFFKSDMERIRDILKKVDLSDRPPKKQPKDDDDDDDEQMEQKRLEIENDIEMSN